MRGADKSDIKDFSEDFVVVEEPEGASRHKRGRSRTNNGIIRIFDSHRLVSTQILQRQN